MTTRKKIAIWTGVAVVTATAATALIMKQLRDRTGTMTGAGLTEDPDPRKQLLIPNVEITVVDGTSVITQKSDSAGLFRLIVPMRAWLSESHRMRFRHSRFRP